MSDENPVYSRRIFNGAVAATAWHSLVPTSVHAAPENRIKLGLIGCGGRGTGAAVQAMTAGDEVVLSAVCDVDRAQAEQAVAIAAKQKPEQVAVPGVSKPYALWY